MVGATGRWVGLQKGTEKLLGVMHMFITLIMVAVSWVYTCCQCVKLCTVFYVQCNVCDSIMGEIRYYWYNRNQLSLGIDSR